MSSRHTRSFFGVMLAVVFALSAVVVAPASAKLTKAQKVHIRKQLKRAIKKNPKLIRSKHFIKKASLVNFKLPVTIVLRDSSKSNNPNTANIDLGPSLGQRSIGLGGKLAAEIVFHDSYDGGALGNVDVNILPSSAKALQTTSIPLLWNDQVTSGRYDYNNLKDSVFAGNLTVSDSAGCSDFTQTSSKFTAYGPVGGPFQSSLKFGQNVIPTNPSPGTPGYPLYSLATAGDPAGSALTPVTPADGYLPIDPGVDDINALSNSGAVGDDRNVGGTSNPFPGSSAPYTPGNDTNSGNYKNAVLRTNALSLHVVSAGTPIEQTDGSGNAEGSQNLVAGKSGGQANLFGDIPGKLGTGVDITVSLETKINSIFRIVDQDSFGSPLIQGNRFPAGIFNCRQIWSGAVQNYITGVRLVGSLKIAPGITPSGALRIAKVKVHTKDTGTPTADAARVALAACLAPYAGYEKERNGSDSTASFFPLPNPTTTANPFTGAAKLTSLSALPAYLDQRRVANAADDATIQSVPCNAAPTGLVKFSALTPDTVQQQAAPTDAAYTTGADGSKVSVSGDLDVGNVTADVIIGDH